MCLSQHYADGTKVACLLPKERQKDTDVTISTRMTLIRGHIIALDPTNKQATYFAKACGVARLAYNWALDNWQKQYQADKTYRDECLKNGIEIDETKLNKPSQGKLRKQLNKKTTIPLYARSNQMQPTTCHHATRRRIQTLF